MEFPRDSHDGGRRVECPNGLYFGDAVTFLYFVCTVSLQVFFGWPSGDSLCVPCHRCIQTKRCAYQSAAPWHNMVDIGGPSGAQSQLQRNSGGQTVDLLVAALSLASKCVGGPQRKDAQGAQVVRKIPSPSLQTQPLLMTYDLCKVPTGEILYDSII